MSEMSLLSQLNVVRLYGVCSLSVLAFHGNVASCPEALSAQEEQCFNMHNVTFLILKGAVVENQHTGDLDLSGFLCWSQL